MNIATITELYTEAENIQSFLEVTMSEQGEEALARGNDLQVYVARTGKMLADAEYRLNEAKQSDMVRQIVNLSNNIDCVTAKAVNAIVDSACKDQQFVYKMIERLNRTATHQLDWCRTVVSKAKADQYAQRNING